MKKLLTVGLVALGMVLATTSAEAGGKVFRGHHGGFHHGFKGFHHKRGFHGDIGDEILIGAGIIGGSILLTGLLTRPYYPPASYPPAPVYYAPPPRAPYCVQDQVYRYLPDGRIQWGTRTTCY